MRQQARNVPRRRPDLELMPTDQRVRMLVAPATLTSFESWDLLRRASDLSVQESKQA